MGTRPRGGDEGGADVIALGQGGQALDVDAEKSAEGICLSLAELRKLRSDVPDRAVALAQLETDTRVIADRAGGGSVSVDAQRLDEGVGSVQGVVAGGLDLLGDPLLQYSHPLVSKGSYGRLAAGPVQESHGLSGEFVVVGCEAIVPGVSDDPLAGRAATATLAGVRRPAGDSALLGEVVKVATYARGGQTEVTGELSGRDGRALTDHRQDPVAGRGITVPVVGIRRP